MPFPTFRRAPRPAPVRATPRTPAAARWGRRTTALALLGLLIAPLLVFATTEPAAAAITTPFTREFSANTNGSVIIRGNTLMTCAASATCTTARAATTGTTSVNNNDFSSIFVDVDADASTFNSSTARVDVPAGGSVLYAALVWGGRLEASGTPAPNAALLDRAKLKVPGSSSYQTVIAERVDKLSPTVPGAYQGFVDVTAQVRAAGTGTYTVADVQAARSSDRYAGWALVVAVSDPAAPARNLTVYSGFGDVTTGASVTIPVSGFLTPPAGPVKTTLGFVSYEGDIGYASDSLSLNSTVLSNARNPATNAFNSSLTDLGVPFAGGNPAYANQLGFDADLIAADGVLANGATSATITLSTGQDVYYPGVVTFATDLYDPKLLGTKTVSDLNGGNVTAGDVLEYTVPVQNIGLDTSTRSTFFDAIPTGTTYVPATLTVNGSARTDTAGDDSGSFVTDANQGHVLVYIGAGATSGSGGSVPADNGTTVHTVTFRVTVNAAATNGQKLINAAALTYRGLTTEASSSSATNATVSPVVAATGTNAPPTATPHILTFSPAPGARTLTIPVLNGDTDPESDPLTVIGVTDAAGGPVTINPDGTVTYVPGDGFAGRDVFTYTISDGNGNTSTALVQIDVVNDPPVAVDDVRTTAAGTALVTAVLPNDSDPNGDAINVRSVVASSAQGGTVTLLGNGSVRYVPAAGFRGTDTFTYVLEDSRGGSDTGAVTVTVVNRAPVAVADSYFTPAATPRAVAVLANDADPDGDPLTAALVVGPAHGTLTFAANGTGSYQPTVGYSGPDSFTYQVTDGQGGTSAVTTVSLTVNTAPDAVDDTASTATNTAVAVPVLANDSDFDAGTLTVVSATQGAFGSTVVNANGTITYIPQAGRSGPDSFTYVLSDGQGGSDTATVAITVSNANPVAVADAASTATGTVVTVAVLANDTDANIPGTTQQLTVTAASGNSGAAVVINPDRSLTVTPTATFRGAVTVSYTVSDGAGGTATGSLVVTVNNSPVVAVNDGPLSTATDTSVLVDVLGNDTDANNDPLSIVPGSLTAAVDGSGTVQGTVVIVAGQVRFTPAAGFAGSVTFGYTASDGSATSSATVSVSVSNAPPVAVADAVGTATGVPVTVAVVGNDTDPNIPGTAQQLSVLSASADNGASVLINADRSVTVTPAGPFKGLVTVNYVVSDGAGGFAAGVLTVTVANAAPVAVNDGPLSTATDTSVLVDVLGNDTDANNDPLSIVPGSLTAAVDGSGTVQGTVVIVAGQVRFTPATGFAGSVTFSYTATDGTVGSTATVTIVVDNAPPVAQSDAVSTATGAPVTVTVLANDTDPNIPGTTQQLLVLVAVADNTATAVVSPDGQSVTVSPTSTFKGVVSVSYVVTDGAGGFAAGTLTVTVNNAGPVGLNDGPVSTPTDASVLVDVLANDTDANRDPLSIVPGSVTVPVDGAGTPQGTAVVEAGRVRFTPATSFAGTVIFSYTATDGTASSTATVTVTVDNASPIAVSDGPVSTPADTSVLVDVLGNDTDANRDLLSIVPGSLTAPVDGAGTGQGTVVIEAGQVRFTPATGFAGTVTFDYTATDGTATSTATVTVIVDNAAPVALADSAITPTGVAVTVDVLANDSDANIPGTRQVLQVVSVTADHGATAVINPNGTVTVTPAVGFRGTLTVGYDITDGATGTTSSTLTVTVDNAGPRALADAVRTPYHQPVAVHVLDNDTDPNGDSLSVVGGSLSVPTDAAGTPQGSVRLVDGVVTYTPPAGFSGVVTFTYTVTDGAQVSTGTVTVTVANALPVATPDSVTVTHGGTVTIDVLGNDVDPDGGTLSIRSVTQPGHGSVAIVDGKVVYTPEPGYTGTVTFTYSISDGHGGTASSTVSVDVLADQIAVSTPTGVRLPHTGAEVANLLLASLGLLGLGSVLMVAARRRREA